MNSLTRRDFIRRTGMSASVLPFLGNLPSLGFANSSGRKQRLIFMFSPNGVVPNTFWPDKPGTDFTLKTSLEPLAPFKDRLLTLKGVCNKLRGDGDGHMRGMGCLLTGIELFPGNVQGGSDTPAGWAKGLSIDQHIANHLQSTEATRTRFGSLELGVRVPDRADAWTRWTYAGPNQPLAPISNPYQLFNKLYGRRADQAMLTSVLDMVRDDLTKLQRSVSVEDRQLLEQHVTHVREAERQLQASKDTTDTHPVPKIPEGLRDHDDNMPALSKMQIDLLVDSFQADYARIATLQYTNSVGGVKMKWLGINEGHHHLSHEPDQKQDVQNQLTSINRWYAEQMAYLLKRLADTKEPGTDQTLLDNTTVVWTNELGKGNSHTRDNIPFVLAGNALNWKMGQAMQFKNVAHNRLLIAFAHAFGSHIDHFGNPELSQGGPLL